MKVPKVRVLPGLLLLLSVGAHAAAQDLAAGAARSDFSTFVQDFVHSYAYVDRAEKPWLTWKLRYAQAVEQADSKEAFASVLASALSELHDFHAEVRSRVPNRWLPVPTFAEIWAEWTIRGAVITAVRRGSDAERAGIHAGDRVLSVNGLTLEQAIAARLTPAASQTDASAKGWALLSVLTGRSDEARNLTLVTPAGRLYRVTLPVERRFSRAAENVSLARLPGDIALLRFNNSLGEQSTVAAFDRLLLEVRTAKGIILDLRDVPSGGDSSVALGIMGRFVSKILPYQRHRIPHYGQTDAERNWVEYVAPRGPFCYAGPVVVLVDHWTGSMGEGMAVGFDAMHRAVVVGTPMAHLAGAVTEERLPATGIDVAYATEQVFHVDGTPRQDWLPPVLVREPVGVSPDDVILTRGLAELRRRRQWPKRDLGQLKPTR